MGQPSEKFDYKVLYSKPPSYEIPIESIIPAGWGDEFEDDESVSEEVKKVKNSEQSQKEVKEEIMPSDGFELLGRKEICMIEIWKDGKRDQTIRVIDIWYNSNEENTEGYNVWADSEVNQVTRSGKDYKPTEKRVEKVVEREEVVKEEDLDEPYYNLILEQVKKVKANVSI